MNSNKLVVFILLLIVCGMSLTACSETPKEQVFRLIDEMEEAMIDDDMERFSKAVIEMETIDMSSFSEKDKVEIARKSAKLVNHLMYELKF